MATRQRIFSIHYRAIIKASGYTSTCDDNIDSFIKIWEPFIEKIDTNLVSGKANHSQSELVSNSQAWIYFALRLISSKIGYEETANKIVYTISALKNIDDQYHELIIFDTLNSVFPSNSSFNVLSARNLISNIYEKLAPLLSSEPDYWLQRAKSIYHNHESNSMTDVLVAIDYAKKALKESDKRVTINARLTKANLYGLLCKLDNFNTESYIFDAIDTYSEAFADYQINSLYLDGVIERNQTDGYLKKLITNVDVMEKTPKFLNYKNKISQLSGLLNSRH